MKPEVTHIVGNKSSRGGVRPGLIVIHTTEGANHRGISDLKGLGDFFDRPDVEASSHVANDSEGHDARYVADEDKAWTCSEDNPFTLNLEQIGFASTGRREWFEDHPKQLANTARWIAYWSEKWGIPIRRGAAPFGVLLRSGVASHKQLGLAGGGHWDPGPSYPMRYVLLLARLINAKSAKKRQKLRRKINRIRRHYGLPPLDPAENR